MAELKKSRLKLKSKKSDHNESLSEVSKVKGQVQKEVDAVVRQQDKDNDVIIIIDEEDEKKTLRLTEADKEWLKLKEKLFCYTLMCEKDDIWQLTDLPPYKPEVYRTIPKQNLDNIQQEFSPLPKLSRKFITSKPCSLDYDACLGTEFASEFNKNSSNSFSSKNVSRLDAELKRKLSESNETQTKQQKSNNSANNMPDASFTEIKDMNQIKPEIKTASCPICSVTFSASVSQMDIDSHIAACLSVAGDDIEW